ncbi:MAG: hypothetical protein AAFV53_38070 [Myxococcota bacterium]
MNTIISLLWMPLAQAGSVNGINLRQRLGEPVLVGRFNIRDTTKMACGEEELDVDLRIIDPTEGASDPVRFSTVDVPVYPTFGRLRSVGWSHQERWSARSGPLVQQVLAAKEKGSSDTIAITLLDCDGGAIDTVKVYIDDMGLDDGDPIYGFAGKNTYGALRADVFTDDDGFDTLSIDVVGAGVSGGTVLYGEWTVAVSFDTARIRVNAPSTVTPEELELDYGFSEDATFQFNTTYSSGATHTGHRSFDNLRHHFQGQGVFQLLLDPDAGTARGVFRGDASFEEELSAGLVTITSGDTVTEAGFSTKSAGSRHTTRSATLATSNPCATSKGRRSCDSYSYTFWIRPTGLRPATSAPSGFYSTDISKSTAGEFNGSLIHEPNADGGYTVTLKATGEETKGGVFVTDTGGTQSRALTFEVGADGTYTYTEEIAGEVASEGKGELSGAGGIDLDGFDWGTSAASPNPDDDSAIVESILNTLLGAEDTDTGGMSWGMGMTSTSNDGTTTGVSSVAFELTADGDDSPVIPAGVSGVLTSQNLNIERTNTFSLKVPSDLSDVDVSIELYTKDSKEPSWGCAQVSVSDTGILCECSHL